jgi:hypothetical protein
MSGISQKKLLQEWDMLLQEARSQEAEVASLASLRESLETAYARARATRSMRDTLRTSTLDSSQRLREALVSGREAAGRLRRCVKSMRRTR